MKFIHTADIHWGMVPDSDRPWGKKREQAIRLTFQAIIEEVKDIRADLLLISGDLFHRQPLARDLKELNYLFSTIPGTRVVIIAGNHDRVRKSSALLSFNWSPNVTYLMDEDLTSVYFEDLNTEIYGFSYHTPEILEDKTAQFAIPDNRRHKILMMHGHTRNVKATGMSAYYAAREMGADVLLYGHTHIPLVDFDGTLYTMNPGAAGDRLRPTCGIITIEDGKASCAVHKI